MIMWTLPRAGARGACREDLVWKFSDYGSQIVGLEVSLVGLTSILIFLKVVQASAAHILIFLKVG